MRCQDRARRRAGTATRSRAWPGMGDLIVTCTSQRSRNRHVGEQLGAGKPIDEIIASMNQVAEGVKAASVIMEFAEKYGLVHADRARGRRRHQSRRNPEDAYRGLAAEAEPRGPRGRFLAFAFSRQAAAFLWVPPKESKSALSGKRSRRPVG